jgi:nucleotide-binding universal stress UspA family protein
VTSLQLAPPPPSASRPADELFPRVVLGIDFGSASLAAARWATAHIAIGADAILSHVVPFPNCLPDGYDEGAARNESIRQMRPALVGGLGGFAATLDVADARAALRIGSPSRWLSAVANDAEASLIVLGRRADANRIRVGEANVIERTARRTSAAVLVVPEGLVHAPARIVAAVDQSAFASKVLAVAQRLARLHEVPLVVLHVLSPAIGAYERVIRTARHLLTRGRRMRRERSDTSSALTASTARWLVDLAQPHLVLGRDRTAVAVGDPAREIVAAAASIAGTVVVVGMRGADDTPPGSLGSVVRELLTRAPMPVIAVNAV